MSLSVSNVVGEGTYGCVHKPSLRCDKLNVDYKEKVSKLMYRVMQIQNCVSI